MSIEELRALADQEATDQVDEPIEEVETEVEEAEEPAPTEEEAEEVDDIELELDDEDLQASKPTPEQALVYKLTKAKKQKKEAASRAEELERENAELKAKLMAPQAPVAQPVQQAPQVIPFPDLYDPNINGDKTKYSQAVHEYMQAVNNQGQQVAQQTQAQQQQAQRLSESATRLAEQSSRFIKDNKLNAEKATDKIQAGINGLDEALGLEGAALDLLDTIGEGSEKLAYFLGSNSEALNKVKQLMSEDPRGFKANTWLTKSALKLTRKNSHISKAPAPDEPLAGDGSTATGSKLQAQYDKETDIKKLMELKRKARVAGITLVNQ